MRLVEKMDAGPVYLQESIAVAPDETTGSLQAKLIPIGSRLLMETLGQLKESRFQPREQDESAVTFAPLLKKEDGLIDWNQSALAIERRVRGLDPWPGAYTRIGNKLLKVHRAKVLPADGKGNPGEVVRADAGGFWIATGSGIVGLEEVQLENKKRLPGIEFIKGARIRTGDRF
jgi:methionyl-tRNA formyltransferase